MYGGTLVDTMVHIMTFCDGMCEGVFMVGELERNYEGDTKLNKHSISESLL